MPRNRVFFPRDALDLWLSEGRVDLAESRLTLGGTGRTYRIVEAVRVLGELTGSPDPHDLVGKVKSTAYVGELGAELVETSMIIGDNAYDVVPGFLGVPATAFREYVESLPEPRPASDEAVLRAFVEGG